MITIDKILFISYDFHEENKPIKSVAIATLEAYLKQYINEIEIDTYSFNMNDEYSIRFSQMATLSKSFLDNSYTHICISLYAWNKRYIKDLLDVVKQSCPDATIVFGGYEVNTMNLNTVLKTYKEIDHFIIGYGEEGLRKLITKEDTSKVLNYKVDNSLIPPIYSNHTIDISHSKNIRLETKRGCPYKCTFCSYKSNDHQGITVQEIMKVKEELLYINQQDLDKVNILDPIFTIKNFKDILEFLVSIQFKPIISLQVKFELVYQVMKKDPSILTLLSTLNTELEFGLQSISKNVLNQIERTNDDQKIKHVIQELNNHNITYEVSIIRGLPGEVLESYKDLLNYLEEIGCARYVSYPLTLLSNTKLYTQKDELELEVITQNGLDYVISTHSYNYPEYLEMMKLEEK